MYVALCLKLRLSHGIPHNTERVKCCCLRVYTVCVHADLSLSIRAIAFFPP